MAGTNKQHGFSLAELMIALLLSSLLSLASIEWFLSLSKYFRSQSLLIDNQEVGHFTLSYLTKSFSRAGAWLPQSETALNFENSSLVIRYNKQLPEVGSVLNCLGNESKDDVISDKFVVRPYQYGGNELKCISSGRGDWLTEGIDQVAYEVAVDQGSFQHGTFIRGVFDGVPDAYISSSQLDLTSMRPIAVRVSTKVYRPTKRSRVHIDYWKDASNANSITRTFSTLVLLPNT